MSNALAQLIVGKAAEASTLDLPDVVQELRNNFPANSMVPMIKRQEGKPSERVRLRRLLKQLRDQGMGISCMDHYDPKDSARVQGGFQQSGVAWRLSVSVEDLTPGETIKTLCAIQEKMHQQALPMLARPNSNGSWTLDMLECDDDEQLAWYEAGLSPAWQEISLHEALQWSAELTTDYWLISLWREEGIDLPTAKRWYARGEGFDWPTEATKWMALQDQGMTAEVAIQLHQQNITAEQAVLVRKLWQAEDENATKK
jgi:hypothetical protein